MYAAGGSLSRTFIFEQFINIARRIDDGVAAVARLLSDGSLPAYEVIDKMFRQVVVVTKNDVERSTGKLLEYLASGRIELVDNKDLVIEAVRLFDAAIYDVEEAVYRLVLLKKYNVEEIPDLNKKIAKMFVTLSEITSEITAIVRFLSRIGTSREILRMLESHVIQVNKAEETIDELYREALDALVASNPSTVQALLYKDVFEKLEATADDFKRLAETFYVMARAYEAGSPL